MIVHQSSAGLTAEVSGAVDSQNAAIHEAHPAAAGSVHLHDEPNSPVVRNARRTIVVATASTHALNTALQNTARSHISTAQSLEAEEASTRPAAVDLAVDHHGFGTRSVEGDSAASVAPDDGVCLAGGVVCIPLTFVVWVCVEELSMLPSAHISMHATTQVHTPPWEQVSLPQPTIVQYPATDSRQALHPVPTPCLTSSSNSAVCSRGPILRITMLHHHRHARRCPERAPGPPKHACHSLQ